jgi:hypothetical protein
MENQQSEMVLFTDTKRPFYCSVKAETLDDKKKLFNALENCDALLNNCVGEELTMKDIYIEQYLDKKDEDDEGRLKYRTIIFADGGKTYVSTSYGIYNILKKIFGIYGEPSNWGDGIKVKVSKRPVGNGKEMLTLILL